MAIRRIDSLGYQIGLLGRLYDRRLQDVLKDYGVAPGQPSSVGGTYFAAIITYWLKQKS